MTHCKCIYMAYLSVLWLALLTTTFASATRFNNDPDFFNKLRESQETEIPANVSANGTLTFHPKTKESHKTMSQILDEMLKKYDKNVRPVVGEDITRPTDVFMDLNIRSMGPISELERSYSMDCYFRQTWVDPRLKYSTQSKTKEITVHIKLLERLWVPDTYFLNGKDSYLHMITTANKLLRIRPDGTVYYSMRLTIKADCPMKLEAYPMDTQYCPLTIVSFAYGAKEVNYLWKYGNNQSIVLSDDVRLSQFDIVFYPHTNGSVPLRETSYSSLNVIFHLQRRMGYYLLQVYVPSMLLVVMSWVTFWLNREATSDRVGLGITVILTMTTMTSDNGKGLPQVPYATALDIYIQMCFIFVVCSIFQFVGVHYFTKTGSGDYHNIDDDSEDEEEEAESELSPEEKKALRAEQKKEKERQYAISSNNRIFHQKRLQKSALAKGLKMMTLGTPVEKEKNCLQKFLHCLKGSQDYRETMRKHAKKQGSRANSVSKLDKISRILFPTSFTALNILYWSVYYFNGERTNYKDTQVNS